MVAFARRGIQGQPFQRSARYRTESGSEQQRGSQARVKECADAFRSNELLDRCLIVRCSRRGMCSHGIKYDLYSGENETAQNRHHIGDEKLSNSGSVEWPNWKFIDQSTNLA